MARRRHRQPLLWCTTVAADGNAWPIFLHVPELSPSLRAVARKGDDGSVMGVADFDRRIVVVNVRLPEHAQDETLLHELGHVALSVREPRMGVPAQHRVLNPLDTPLCALLRAAGVRFPPRPRAYAAFRRWALETAP